MRWLGGLELGLRHLVEGRLARVFGGRLQPVDIAKRLAEHMDRSPVVGAGRLYVPNVYRAYIAPRTLAAFAGSKSTLEEDLAAYLDAHAREAGYDLVGRIRVTLLADPALPTETLRLDADLVDRHGLDLGGDGRTQAIPVVESPSVPNAETVALVTGHRRHRLPRAGAVTVGRALDNKVILDHASVSRHHARLSPRSGHWLLEDLDSTHGTFVNGRRVSAGLVRAGDQLRFGSLVAYLESDEGTAP
jgi:hypothetical protein